MNKTALFMVSIVFTGIVIGLSSPPPLGASVLRTIPPNTAISWSLDGNRLAIGGPDGIKLYTSSFEAIETLPITGDQVWALAWSPDNIHLAGLIWTPSDSRQPCVFLDIIIWNVETHEVSLLTDCPGPASISWRGDGAFIANGDANGYTYIWDATSREEVMHFSSEVTYTRFPVDTTCWSLDGTQLYTLYTDTVFRWDMSLDAIAETVSYPENGCDADRKRLVDMDGKVWSLTERKVMFRFPDEFSGEVTAAWSPNGNRIATNTWNPIEVQIWDVTTHQLLTTLPSGQDGIGTWHYRNTIAWSPDGSLLATLTQGGDVQIWETDTFSLVFELGIGARKGG